MYNAFFFLFLTVLVLVSENDITNQTAFILKSICIMLTGVGTVSIAILKKMWLIYKGKQSKSKQQTKMHVSTGSGSKTASTAGGADT